MFTGIIQEIAQLIDIKDKKGYLTYTLKLPTAMIASLKVGYSISNDGCCLTIVDISGDTVSFDLVAETLAITTLGRKIIGDYINVERAAKLGDEIGGHLMSGHIACRGKIVQIQPSINNYQLTVMIPKPFAKYILYKGFFGIDGISLTVGKVVDNTFKLHLIPETLARTTLSHKKEGEEVNIEIDTQTQTIVDTVERIMQGEV